MMAKSMSNNLKKALMPAIRRRKNISNQTKKKHKYTNLFHKQQTNSKNSRWYQIMRSGKKQYTSIVVWNNNNDDEGKMSRRSLTPRALATHRSLRWLASCCWLLVCMYCIQKDRDWWWYNASMKIKRWKSDVDFL